MTLSLPPNPPRIEFSLAPVDSAADRPLRLRRKLEGLERDWQEAGGEMQVLAIVHGDSNHVLSYHGFSMSGESKGWNERVQNSPFQFRRESIVLPEGSKRLQVLLISEDWAVLGAAAIADFRVLRTNESGRAENIWTDSNFEEGENLERADGRPRYWQRGGFGASMAHVFQFSPPATGHALMIMDDDVHSSATWQADLPLKDKARAGETLTLEWREAFSVGIGGRNRKTYDRLPPGEYVFRLKTVTPSGEPIGSEATLAVFIPQVFWKRPWVLALAFVIFAAAMAATIRAFGHRRLQARLDRLEYRRSLERERVRIAQDIHDDLGASLTHVNLLSQTALGKMDGTHPAWKDTERLRTLAVHLTRTLDEIVWAVSPRHDTIESFLSYLTDFAEEFLETAGIRARIRVPLQLPTWLMPSGLRHNVFLAAKEVLNNVVKHSRATEVQLRLTPLTDGFELSIEDNGHGFSPTSFAPSGSGRSARHGLGGVKERIESLGGKFSLDSAPGRGTRVAFMVPVKLVES